MSWFRRRKAAAPKGGTAGRGRGRFTRLPARTDPRRTAKSRRDQRPPLDWSDPDRDFITRYGDPFDG